MASVPKFTKRAAIEIARLEARFAEDRPAGKYMPVVGWEVGFDKNFVPRPALGLHEVHLVPGDLQIECHQMRLAYNLPDRVMATLHSSILDFDGKQFLFVDCKSGKEP